MTEISNDELVAIVKSLAETVHSSLSERSSEIHTIKSSVEKTSDAIGRVERTIEGNGHLPFAERIVRTELKLESVGEDVKSHTAKFDKIQWWIIGLLAAIIGILVTTAVQFLTG